MNFRFIRKVALMAAMSFFAFGLSAHQRAGGSTGGGGPIIYQAKAIEAIMNDRTFLWTFKDLNRANYVKSITHLSWSRGVTKYLVTTDKGCMLIAQTKVKNPEGTDYKVTVGKLVCP